jgi:hypothetical protein
MAKSWKSISVMTAVALLVAMAAALVPASPVQADQVYENHSGTTGSQYPGGGGMVRTDLHRPVEPRCHFREAIPQPLG